jgi:hypothetical protein
MWNAWNSTPPALGIKSLYDLKYFHLLTQWTRVCFLRPCFRQLVAAELHANRRAHINIGAISLLA